MRRAVLLFLGIMVLGGCAAVKPGHLTEVEPITTNERVGSVYLMRGFIGIFSQGIDRLGRRLNEAGIHAEVFQESQTAALADTIAERYRNVPQHEPIVLVGHSYGADSVVAVARRLNKHNIRVDLLVTLDPVTPGKVPGNVVLAYNLYQSNGTFDALPFLRGIPLKADDPGPKTLRNMNIRRERTELLEPGLDHFNIEKKEKIQKDVVRQIMEVCMTREVWARTHHAPHVIAISSTDDPVTPPASDGASSARNSR